MLTATELMRWYLNEAQRFTRQTAVPLAVRHAEMLEEWLVKQAFDGMVTVPTALVCKMGPNPLRKAADRDAAFEILEAHNRAKLFTAGQKKEYGLSPKVLKEHRG